MSDFFWIDFWQSRDYPKAEHLNILSKNEVPCNIPDFLLA
uniref:Uncharacterized protein n=1 Tax=uncultured bacterium A1Q1_fos_2140 TaxID=1256565 RepID=L7VXT2_9BACT|nr:hypothetical protein [uncultured bacterium A1Q1_fos_2140]